MHHTRAVDTVDWSTIEFNPEEFSSYTSLNETLIKLIIQSQDESYRKERERLRKRKPVQKGSSLLRLDPFLDANNVLRVGGRLTEAKRPFEQKHQIILPKNHEFTRKIIKAFHQRLNHFGTDFILSHIHQFYWPVNGREAVKKVGRECVTCQLERAKPKPQFMGGIPKERLAMFKPAFTNTSMDFFGPILVASGRGNPVKRYGVIFTCLTTRAVHLDLATSLSTLDFKEVFRRFQAIYGTPEIIVSDNGRNFVRGEKELQAETKELNDRIPHNPYLKSVKVIWKFQPPGSPHFGGAHESMIKTVKSAFYRTLKRDADKQKYPTEQGAQTLLFEIASFLNARPLTYVSSDPHDQAPLTPNDLLGRSNRKFIPPPVDDALPTDRYKYVQHLANTIWHEWQSRYLPSLVARSKWNTKNRNFEIGDLVLITEPNLPRNQWLLGNIVEVYPGKDNLVRVAQIKTKYGIYKRSVNKLCLIKPNKQSN